MIHLNEHVRYTTGNCQKLWTFFFFLFALRPKSTAIVIAGRSVHLNTLFPGQA